MKLLALSVVLSLIMSLAGCSWWGGSAPASPAPVRPTAHSPTPAKTGDAPTSPSEASQKAPDPEDRGLLGLLPSWWPTGLAFVAILALALAIFVLIKNSMHEETEHRLPAYTPPDSHTRDFDNLRMQLNELESKIARYLNPLGEHLQQAVHNLQRIEGSVRDVAPSVNDNLMRQMISVTAELGKIRDETLSFEKHIRQYYNEFAMDHQKWEARSEERYDYFYDRINKCMQAVGQIKMQQLASSQAPLVQDPSTDREADNVLRLAAANPSLVTIGELAERIVENVSSISDQAPPALKSRLDQSARLVVEQAHSFAQLGSAATSHKLEFDLSFTIGNRGDALRQILEQTAKHFGQLTRIAQNSEREWRELTESLIPTIVDLCDGSAANPEAGASDFYRRLPSWIDGLLSAAGIDSIQPLPGAAHNASRFAVLKLTSPERPEMVETVAACHARGYSRGSEVIRKASVTLYR